MIITILFVIIAVIGLVLFIIGKKKADNDGWWNDSGDRLLIGGSITGLIALVGALTCVILVAIVNSPNSHYAARIHHDELVTEMAINKEMIENITDDHARSVAIKDYNAKVRAYKADVLETQHYLKSPWVNWFFNAEYASFSVDDISYITTY